MNEGVGLWVERGNPPGEVAEAMACTVRCTGDLLDLKFAALAAHTTQTAPLIERLGRARYCRWWANEYVVEGGIPIGRAAA